MKKILNFIKEHPYLTFSIIFNLLLGITNSIIYNYILFFIITFIVVILITVIYLKSKNKFPLFSKVFYMFFNIMITGFLIATLSFMLLFNWTFSNEEKEYTKIKDYQKALNSYDFELISHFPAQIPKNAKNISLLRTKSDFRGYSKFYLKFDINKEFIKKEEEYFKSTEKTKVDDFTKINTNNILYSIIHEKTQDWNIKILGSNSCFKGIAIKGNTIIYILYCN